MRLKLPRKCGLWPSCSGMGFLFLLGLGVISNAEETEREQIRLDGEWDFTFQGSSVAETPALPADHAYQAKIKIPGWWDDQLDRFSQSDWFETPPFKSALGSVRFLAGIGWHRKRFDVPEDWQGRPVTLTVGRAITVVNVWLNGEHIGRYDYGVYTPFEIDLTKRLKFGAENEIVIAVDNTKGFAGGWAHLGNAGRASGITQSVVIDIAAGSGRIRDLFIEPGEDLNIVRWNVELETPFREERTAQTALKWEIWDLKGERRLARGTTEVPAFLAENRLAWTAQISEIEPWSDREPNLYQTRLQWVDEDGSVLDSLEQRFGLRRYTFEGRELFLNGKPLYLRGSFGHYYFPKHTTPPTDKEYWLNVFRRAKSVGINFVNFAAQVTPFEMLEAADEEGMILQCGDHYTVLQTHTEHYQEVWTPIVRWTRRHPSLAIYGFGGEVDYYEGIIEQYQKQHDFIKSLYSEALVMPQQAIRGIDYAFDVQGTKELTNEPFPHHSERLERYTHATDLFGHYSGGALSYSYDQPPHWQEMDERFRLYRKPLVHHELFMGASYLNPENAKHYTGRTEPYLYTDLEERLKEAGLYQKWPTYYRNSALLQDICAKFNLEKVRKCHELAGFELLGLYDMHFMPHYGVGILDEFMQLKTQTDDQSILRYNGESVLLIDYDNGASLNRAFYENTPFAADVYFSYFGDVDFGGGDFEWSVTRKGETIASNSFPVEQIAAGRVVKIRGIEFEWPNVSETTKLNLRFSLSGDGKEFLNDWDFWVFPRREPPSVTATVEEKLLPILGKRYPGLVTPDRATESQLMIVSKIGTEELDFLTRGGDLVLLGTDPFLTNKGYNRFRSGLGGRPHHNLGSILSDHPIFADLPNEGWGDWHFYHILNGATPFLIDEEAMGGFNPIIEIISSPADLRKQAVIFERRVGAGRLLASSSVINLENPATVALLDGILGYVGGPKFSPRLLLPREVVLSDLGVPEDIDPDNLLPASNFEGRRYVMANWKAYGEGFEHDQTTAKRGNGSLRIGVSPEDLAENPGIYVGAVAPTITLDETPSEMKFSAWYKTDAISGRANDDFLFVIAVELHSGAPVRIRIPLQTGTNGWQYIEKTWKPDAEIRRVGLHLGMVRKTGSAWIDDVFLGRSKDAGVFSQAATATDEEWSNKPVTLRVGPNSSYRIGEGAWIEAPEATVSREGVTRVVIRREGSEAEEVRMVQIDATPPTLELSARPALDQAGGEYSATSTTRFLLTATDQLSGVARIEYRVNGGEYREYADPFGLPPGRHAISVRVTDRAGNTNTSISGEMITGGETASLIVSVQ